MADTKLSALTELAATPANDDEVYIRDVSEVASAESKRITIANLLAGAGGGITFDNSEVFNGIPASTAYLDLDLSAVVGSNQAVVLLAVYPAINPNEIKFRKNGETDNLGSAASAQGPSVGKPSTSSEMTYILVVADSSGIVEWKHNASDPTIVINMEAYWT